MTMPVPADGVPTARSPFAGADLCAWTGFQLPPQVVRPMFDDDVWDFAAVAGLPVSMTRSTRRLDFTAITVPPWQLVAKELMFALLVPGHDAVVTLPRAVRVPLHLASCHARLAELATLLNWLAGQGITGLDQVDTDHCGRYLHHRSHIYTAGGTVAGDLSPATRRMAVQAVLDLIDYRDLFTTSAVRAGLRPWGNRSSCAVAGLRSAPNSNSTPPVPQEIFQPMLAAALYVVGTLGPHVRELTRQARTARSNRHLLRQVSGSSRPPGELTAVLHRHIATGSPLPQLTGYEIRQRLNAGWREDDPVLPVSITQLAAEAGDDEFPRCWLKVLRPAIEDAVGQVGTAPPWARDAPQVQDAAGEDHLPWTRPLFPLEVIAVTEMTRTAAATVIAALSGMRSGELMELTVGCRLPPAQQAPGLARYRLAGKVVKGRPLGGTADEWVVVEPVFTAVDLVEQLHTDRAEGASLLGRLSFSSRFPNFRDWVNGSAGQRLNLAPIPDGPVSLRMLRRTLAIELAYRPGGVLAAKIHMKHLTVVTTEGYAARPGGAQAQLLAEVNKHQSQRKLDLTLQEFRNYQAGIMPSGPGAAELAAFFAGVDRAITSTPGGAAEAPKVQRNDRDILNLLSRRAATLHLGIANYCWFADPSRALCLKLAGTPSAKTPLAGMCDSARCPQATHHAVHRPVWAEHAESTTTFIGNLGPARRTERARLHGDLDRALAVIAGIDAATGDTASDPAEEEEPCD